jgi:hypothetical protein
VLALAAVIVIALPVFSLRLGLDDAGSDPPGTTTRQAYTLLAEGFGPGFSGPLQLVAELPSPAAEARFAALTRTLARQPGVVAVTPAVLSPGGTIATADLYPATSPQSAQTRPCSAGSAATSSPGPRPAPASPSWSAAPPPSRPTSPASCPPSSSCSSPSSSRWASCC